MLPFKLWVDADALPKILRDVILRASDRYQLEVTFVANQNVGIQPSVRINSIQVMQGADVADQEIISRMQTHDIVITQDIPLDVLKSYDNDYNILYVAYKKKLYKGLKNMEFCPECGSMLLPTEDNELKCSCGYTKKLSKDKSEYNVNEKIKENDSVIEKGEDVNTLPTTKAVCPECGHTEASWWLQQTRSADEAETRFFKCLKCGHTWREYD